MPGLQRTFQLKLNQSTYIFIRQSSFLQRHYFNLLIWYIMSITSQTYFTCDTVPLFCHPHGIDNKVLLFFKHDTLDMMHGNISVR